MSRPFLSPPLPTLTTSRRRFVQGLATGGLLAGLPSLAAALPTAAELSGREIFLTVDELKVNFTGSAQIATAINGSIPAPTLRLREGDDVTIHVTNNLKVPTSIHWHGIILPFDMDGVPGISFRGIAPGETFTYRFTLQQSGTYWYHSHTGFQEITGMYGALIIEPKEKELHPSEQDHVIQLSDWMNENPMSAFAKLKVQSDIYNFNQPTFFDFTKDVAEQGFRAALQKRQMWNQMRMNPTDLADLSSASMTYLMNGKTPAGNWTGLFKQGERVRLRFINAASNSFYDVRIPGLKMTLIQADGQNVKPVKMDEFRFGPGETYDVIVAPTQSAYTVFAQNMDRSGYAKGTLALEAGLQSDTPELDPVEWLTMADMMGAMNHDGMNHSDMNDSSMNHGNMNHEAHTNPLAKPSSKVRHASSEYSPSVDMRVDMPRTNLNDPGIGLRNLVAKGLRPAGHKVLTLADIRAEHGVLDDPNTPIKEIELHLTGNMERYSWSFDGLEFGQSTPVSLPHNQRVRIILQNDTMMTHPMHLHGMWSDLENDQGELLARRHTIAVQPAQRISFLTTPHDIGRWAWHCHLLFHMDAGMFREVVVS